MLARETASITVTSGGDGTSSSSGSSFWARKTEKLPEVITTPIGKVPTETANKALTMIFVAIVGLMAYGIFTYAKQPR